MHPINCALDDNLVSDSNNITMTANTALFILGGVVFLVAFSWFKAAALKLYSTSINKDAYDNKNEWLNLFRVFLVDTKNDRKFFVKVFFQNRIVAHL